MQEVVNLDGDVGQDVGRINELHHTLLHLDSAVAVLLGDDVAARDTELFNSWAEGELCRLNRSKDVRLVVLIGAHLPAQNGTRLVADCSRDVKTDSLLLDLSCWQLYRCPLGSWLGQANADTILRSFSFALFAVLGLLRLATPYPRAFLRSTALVCLLNLFQVKNIEKPEPRFLYPKTIPYCLSCCEKMFVIDLLAVLSRELLSDSRPRSICFPPRSL